MTTDHETNTATPDALRLADALEAGNCSLREVMAPAAQELRRLHAALAAPVPAAQTPPNDSPRSAEDSPRSPDAGPAAPSQVCAPASPGLERTFPGLAAQGATQGPWLIEQTDGTLEKTHDRNRADLARHLGHTVTPLYAAPVGQAEDAARWRKLTSYRTLSADVAHWNGPRRKEDADAWIDGIPARQAVQSEPGDAK